MIEDGDNIDFGDEKIFRGVFDDCYHPLCFYAARVLGDDHSAGDVVQEVFLRLWERKMVFEAPRTMKAYLYSSIWNACLNGRKSLGTHRRHHSVIVGEAGKNTHDEPSFLADTIEAEVFSEIFHTVEQLPVGCRKVFELSYLEGMSVEAVASELDISVNTVKTQRSRAKKLLRERLKNLYSILILVFFV